MAKHCETFEHTADMGLAATADTLGELFEALGEGLADVICPREQVSPAGRRRLAVAAEDVEALAVDYLVKIMTTIQTDRFVIAAVRVEEMSPGAVRAEVAGEPYDPNRHELDREVKAVTYHQLKVAHEGGAWVARVILDL